jgi:hypothetical protein
MLNIEGQRHRYNFYTLQREFIRFDEEDWNFFTKVFIHVARVCSNFVKFDEATFDYSTPVKEKKKRKRSFK